VDSWSFTLLAEYWWVRALWITAIHSLIGRTLGESPDTDTWILVILQISQGFDPFIVGLYYDIRKVKLLLFLTFIVTKKPLSASN
jgi:hypothetical protein